MRITKKLVALVLCVLMVATVLPMGVFAEDTTYVTNDYDVYLPFDDATTEQVATYFKMHNTGSNLSYYGNTGKSGSSYFFANYVTEEDGNKYVYQQGYTNSGYAIRNDAGCDNFGRIFQISLRFMAQSNGSTLTTGLYIPVVRSSNSSNKTSSSGFANLLVLANTSSYPGEAKTTDGSKYRIGYLIPGVDATTTYNHTGYAIMSDTWYDVTFMADYATGKCAFSVTDGTNYYDHEYTNNTMKGHDIFNQFTLFRTYSAAQSTWLGLDDIRVTNIPSNFRIGNDMNGLAYAEGTDETTGEAYTHASTTPSLLGFEESGSSNANWDLITEEDGNKYISHIQGASAAPLTFKDTLNLMDMGDFSYSFDYKWGAGVSSSGAGMLSVKIDTQGALSEFRIINMGPDGSLYFGPALMGTLKIATLTTPDSEDGAQWHNIKVVFKPFVKVDYIDMNYEFYIDGKLAAYTDIVYAADGNYSYNFYSKGSGSWAVTADLQPAKYVATGIKSGDTNENGVADEGETIVYNYSWDGVPSDEAWHCSWGDSKDNVGRLPVGYWDGYDQIELDGTENRVNQDGAIATLASIYMFHWNTAELNLDNLKVELLEEKDAIESAEVVGYQLNEAKDSVRFIACVDSQEFGRVGVDVLAFDPTEDIATSKTVEPLWVTKTNSTMTNTVYTALTADGVQIGAMEAYGARFFATLTLTDIDSSATLLLRPYTTKDEVRTYGEAVAYVITCTDGVVSVKAPETHSADYSDGFVNSYADNGYCRNKWANYTWAELESPLADIGWGGESSNRSASLQADGSIKITTDLIFKATDKIQKEVAVLDEETGEPTYDENGDPITTLVDVTDNDGNQLYDNANISRRIKFAHVIPANLEDYKGYTFVITAKIKATQIYGEVMKDVTVGEGESAEVYSAVFDDVDEDGQCGFAFGFMTDYKTWMLPGASNSYVISNNGEWLEVSAAINIDDALLAHEYVAPKEAERGPVTDSEGTVHPAPLRPTINLADTVEDGYLRECYVKDLTLTVIPTPGYVAAE